MTKHFKGKDEHENIPGWDGAVLKLTRTQATAPIRFDPELRTGIRAANPDLPVLLSEAEVRAAWT